MHTFFINTTGKEIENYSGVLEIQHETRRLISLDCKLKDWYHDGIGYKACAEKMGELIDNCNDINNDFNLIVYVNLSEAREYTEIPHNNLLERSACLECMHSMVKRYIKHTIVNELDVCGRLPNQVMIIFEEDSEPGDNAGNTSVGKNNRREYASKLIGLPEDNVLESTFAKLEKSQIEANHSELCQKTAELFQSKFLDGFSTVCSSEIELFISEICEYGSYKQPLQNFLDRVIENLSFKGAPVYSVSFYTGLAAGARNKQLKIQNDLTLSFYISDCVESESLLEISGNESAKAYLPKQIPQIDWDRAAKKLSEKMCLYQKVYSHIRSMSDNFSEINLAPDLYAFDYKKFAFDEYGKKAHKYEVVDVDINDKTASDSNDGKEKAIGSIEQKAVVVSEQDFESLFSQSEFEIPDYDGEALQSRELTPHSPAKMFIEQARLLREHHIEFFKKLKLHTLKVLSNYSGCSAENDPALLKKRNVSISDVDIAGNENICNYTDGNIKETQKLNSVKEIAANAYESAVLNYMEFCAGRTVSVTDIEQQCDSFVTTIHQISESLRKIKAISLGLLISVIVLYIPYVAIQWNSIFSGAAPFFTALCSVVIPLLVLYGVLGYALAVQRRKFYLKWKEFEAKSNAVLEQNKIAAQKYDKLLNAVIPTLRWVYEYKLDVEFYEECCRMAKVKVNHHLQKLHERMIKLKNIIDDLEADAACDTSETQYESDAFSVAGIIDFNASFCSGEKNTSFYSVADCGFLESVSVKKGGHRE